jgi:hypothetical protein
VSAFKNTSSYPRKLRPEISTILKLENLTFILVFRDYIWAIEGKDLTSIIQLNKVLCDEGVFGSGVRALRILILGIRF